ncbi:MAG: Type secretory pathway, VirB2 component (pilins), partial [Rickettsiaceae bacterium]|nr:Type secretory pathway, VirB2 component (pilins) [Rickettsiaceae bacterium]
QNKMQIESNAYWNVAFMFILAAAAFMIPAESFAQAASTPVDEVICNIVEQLQGPVARGVAAFGIIFLGFSLFLGKISWGVALALGIGIGAIFGANQIVGLISGEGDACA